MSVFVVGGAGGGGLLATATVIFACLFIISIKRSFYDLVGQLRDFPGYFEVVFFYITSWARRLTPDEVIK